MAIWQFDLFLVHAEDALPVLGADGWTLPRSPAASTLRAQEILIAALGRPWLMLDDWVVFGDETGTRADLVFDDADNVEIGIRIDVSATNSELDTICGFALALNGRFFDPATRVLLHPDRKTLASALAGSGAAAFGRSHA
jgi:hypothetical protein